MADQIIVCPHCQKQIPLTEALSHQLSEKIKTELVSSFKKQQEEDREKMRIFTANKIASEKDRIEKETLEKLEKKIRQENELKLKDRENEALELKKQNKELQNQILELTKMSRQLKIDRDNDKLENQKKLFAEEEKIRTEAKIKAEEESHLKILEKEKQLNDALKVNEELKRKLSQGSMQTQGEVLELEIEDILKAEFPYDELKPIAKGVRGGDVIQIVHDASGRPCGSIIWEIKQTKNWTEGWIGKLKEDQRNIKAQLAVIVTEALPADIKNFGPKNGLWITKRSEVVGLAHALRRTLILVYHANLSTTGKNEKKEVLYSYINSTEFAQRIEAVMDSYGSLLEDLEKEKRWFTGKWAKQEKNIRTVVDQTIGLHGDLQGIVGKTLAPIKSLELESGVDENNTSEDSQTSLL